MRAICEACHLPQPTDWRAGDLCVHCGKTARAESRCFWCVKWTPEGKYCRHCGAETVEEHLFGAARMLKDAGTDRFTVPKLLRELPADQIENFTFIYQRHGVVLARHVDDLLFLERFLHQQHWSTELEERLIKELPWTDEEAEKYTLPPISPMADLERVKEIHRISPFESTRALAAMAALKLGLEGYQPSPPTYLGNDLPITMSARSGEVPPGKELLREVRETLHSPEPKLRLEAGLTLSHWRVLYSFGFPESRQDLLGALSQSQTYSATVGRALLGDKVELPQQTTSINHDVEFAAALVLGEIDRLRTAMGGDRLQRLAAGLRLSDLDVYEPLADTLRSGDPDLQWQLLQNISHARRKKGPVPELRDVFYELLESSNYDKIVEYAGRMLCMEAKNVDIPRILRAVHNNFSGLQAVLQSDMDSQDAVAIAAFLVEQGTFKMSQYGLSDLATKGKVPDDFVCRHFQLADDPTREELCLFAEAQLIERGDEELHRFMLNVVLGPYSPQVHTAAWWGLYRWYGRQEYASTGPLKISKEPIERFFGSVANFLERLIDILQDTASLKEISYAEFMSKLLKYHDAAVLPELVKEERLSLQLRDVLIDCMKNAELWSPLRSACADLLGLLAMNDEWLVEIYRTFLQLKGTDMEGTSLILLDRLSREYEDLGEGEGRNAPAPDFDWQAQIEKAEEESDWR